MTDTVVQELVINTLTQGQFKAAQEAGTLSPYELYGTPDTSFRLPVLTPMWFDHIANDVSWLRADTFSWQSGDVYVAAYEHLADDIDGKTLHSETIAGTTIQFYLADDGHKICPASEESNVTSIYNATGVAWYYIIDTVNKQFKLPRTKWGFTGLRDSVGGYVAQDVLLPNITGNVTGLGDVSVSGAFARGYRVAGNGGGSGSITVDTFDASRSSSVYSGDGTNTLIQPRGTQMYLYFYVGNFEQSAIEQTAGVTTEILNNKADKNDTVGYCSFNTDTRVQITDTDQTATKNGWLIGFISISGNNVYMSVYINGEEVVHSPWTSSQVWGACSICVPIKAGQTYRYYGNAAVEQNKMYFYPND